MAEDSSSAGRILAGIKRRAPFIRVAVSIAMLAGVFLWKHPGELFPRFEPDKIGWLAAAVVVTIIGIVVSALRWQRVLAALEVRAKLRTLLSTYLASLFVGNFLPSTIGGDLLRISRLSATTGEGPWTFASVVLERLTGWIVLPFLTIIAVIANPGLRRVAPDEIRIALLVAGVTLTLLVALLAAATSTRVGGRLASNEGWRRFTGAVHFGLARFRRHPALVLEVLAVGFAYQLIVMFSAFLAAHAMGLPVGWTAILAFMPAVAIVQVLPITMGGLGVREGAFVVFLHPLGVSTQQAIALGLLVYGLNLVASLLGAPAFAAGAPRRSARLPA